MSQISNIETKLRRLKDGDDRISQVIDELLRITKEIDVLQKEVKQLEK